MAKQITLSQLRQASEKAKQYVDAQATAQVIRTETVLWSSSSQITTNQVITLSQSLEDFDAVLFIAGAGEGLISRRQETELSLSDFTTGQIAGFNIVANPEYYTSWGVRRDSNTQLTAVDVQRGTGWANTPTGIAKIYGIKYTVPETYSTSEQIVGTWIDGNPIYQKTISTTGLSVGQSWVDTSEPSSGKDKIIDCVGYSAYGTYLPMFAAVSASAGYVQLLCVYPNGNVSPEFVTLKYTKTT